MSWMTYMEGVVYKKVDKEVNKEVDKEVDEYETYAVEKELNEGSELEDEVMVVEADLIFVIFSPHRFSPHRFFSTQI